MPPTPSRRSAETRQRAPERILHFMTGSHPDHGFSCTLDGPAFRFREGEFRELFARSLSGVERHDARSARLLLNADCEVELRELLARETRCCSFFEFVLDAARSAEHVGLTVRVPIGSEAALAFLLGLAPTLPRPAVHRAASAQLQ